MARASDPRFRAERGGEGIGLGPVFVVGLVLLIVGALMVVHAVSAPASPPPGAEKVPGTVTTAVPPLGNHNLAGWYTGSVTPGQDGSAIILGHVDTYTGSSVFYAIKNLRRDQQIDIVRADGTTAVFAVDGVRRVAKATFPASSVYGNVGYPALRLITCGGPFDDKTGEYLDNIVVYAHLTATYVAAWTAGAGAAPAVI